MPKKFIKKDYNNNIEITSKFSCLDEEVIVPLLKYLEMRRQVFFLILGNRFYWPAQCKNNYNKYIYNITNKNKYIILKMY